MRRNNLPRMDLKFLGLGSLMTVPIMACIALFVPDDKTEYVVSDKGANKIEYYSLDNPNAKHIMTFDDDKLGAEYGWYNYINVGDTISGYAHLLNDSVNSSWYYASKRLDMQFPRIRAVNGLSLTEAREANAHRDSIMHEMKKKQR